MPSSDGMLLFLVLTLYCCSLARGEEEEEEASPVAVATGATLMGAIGFQMSLFYFMNHPDPDMRKHTYTVITSTVAIFCAVLLFQSFAGMVEVYFLDGASEWYKVCVHMGHMLFWYIILQLTLAAISGAVTADEVIETLPVSRRTKTSIESCMDGIRKMWLRVTRCCRAVEREQTHDDEETLEDKAEAREKAAKERNEANMKCFGFLLAHMTGFASINAWGTLQQTEFFRQSPLSAFALVPIALLGQFLLQRTSDHFREKIALSDDGEWDEHEEVWAENTAEAEDDVMALTASFLVAQALRFWISGVLPNAEGMESPKTSDKHCYSQVFKLYATGWLLAIVPFMFKYRMEDVQDALNKFFPKNYETAKRTATGVASACGMCFAWCLFYATRWMWAYFHYTEERILLGTILACYISFVSFFLIYVLDKISDAECTGEETDRALTDIINFVGFVVGFAWEQCFDVATEALAVNMPFATHIGKLVLAIACAVVIVPAWRWWILPMSISNGWKFGFVLDMDGPLFDKDHHEIWRDIVTHPRFKELIHHVEYEHNRQSCEMESTWDNAVERLLPEAEANPEGISPRTSRTPRTPREKASMSIGSVKRIASSVSGSQSARSARSEMAEECPYRPLPGDAHASNCAGVAQASAANMDMEAALGRVLRDYNRHLGAMDNTIRFMEAVMQRNAAAARSC